MKKILGLILTLAASLTTIWLCIITPILEYGINVGFHSLDSVNDSFFTIIKINSFFLLLLTALNFIFLHFLTQSKWPILKSVFISVFIFFLTLPAAYIERNYYFIRDNYNTVNFEVKTIQKIKVQNLRTKQVFYLNKFKHEHIWELEYILNNENSTIKEDLQTVPLYHIEITLKKGKLQFISSSRNLEHWMNEFDN